MDLSQCLAPRRWAWPLALVGLAFLGTAQPASADDRAGAADRASAAWLDELRAFVPQLPRGVRSNPVALTPQQLDPYEGAFGARLLRLGPDLPRQLAAAVEARVDLAELRRAALDVLEHAGRHAARPALREGIRAAASSTPGAFRSAVAYVAPTEADDERTLRAALTLDWQVPPPSGKLPRPRPPAASDGALVLRSPHTNSDVLWTLPQSELQALRNDPGRLAVLGDDALRARLVPHWAGEQLENRLHTWIGLALGPLACWVQLAHAPAPGRGSGVSLFEPVRLRLSALVQEADGGRRQRHVGPSWVLSYEDDDDPRRSNKVLTATCQAPSRRSVLPERPCAPVIRQALSRPELPARARSR